MEALTTEQDQDIFSLVAEIHVEPIQTLRQQDMGESVPFLGEDFAC